MSDVAAFYGAYAGLYDAIATLPGVGRWREAAADSLDLSAGDVVVEMGCGSGANLPHLASRVGPAGHVVGVDLTPELLSLARRRTAALDLENVSLVRGDATRPPVERADAVLGTFVTGMFRDPAAVVETWCSLASGRVALMDLSASTHPLGRALNPGFRAFTAASTPSSTPADLARSVLPGAEADAALTRRVRAGRAALTDRTRDRHYRTFALGFCGLLSGRVG